MFDHDLQQRYEHICAPDDEAGVHEVLVEDHDRVLAVTVVFYDTREFEDERSRKMHWVPARLHYHDWGYDYAEEEGLEVGGNCSPVDQLPGRLWRWGVVVADTPGARGLIAELSEFDEHAGKSITARGCYLGKLIQSLWTLWD